MNIKSIVIELELGPDDIKDHATVLKFFNGMWSCNGPVYNRISLAMAEIWKLLRGAR